MAHEIMKHDKLVLADKKAWHGLGTVVEGAPSVDEALKLGGLEWDVNQTPLYTLIEGTDGEMKKVVVESHVANTRSDNDHLLGIVGKDYKPVQNRQLGKFVLEVAEDSDLVEIESAGSIRNGETVWFLARAKSMITVGKDDTLQPYVMFTNGHSGKLSCWVVPTIVRVVCRNTHSAVVKGIDGKERSGKAFNFRHTATVQERVQGSRDAIISAMKGIEEYGEFAKATASKQFSGEAQLRDFFLDVYQASWGMVPTEVRNATDQRKYDRAVETVASWITNFSNEKNSLSGIGGTVWAGLNAVTEWADHDKVVRAHGGMTKNDARIHSTLFGSSASLKKVAHDKASKLIATL
jgi:phage/plasmid-like protein (TIGR03299 family)